MAKAKVVIEWSQVPDQNLKEGLRRLLQLTTPHGVSRTDRPLILEVELLDTCCLDRLWAMPPYIRVTLE